MTKDKKCETKKLIEQHKQQKFTEDNYYSTDNMSKEQFDRDVE